MTTNYDLELRIDRLGYLKAQIADLQKQAKELQGAIFEDIDALGETAYDGVAFRAAVVQQERTTVDWKSVAQRLNPSRQLVAAHTKVTPVVSLKLSARKQAVA